MNKNNINIIGIIGRTNSGKSTLLNNIVGKKIAATANKVNTTRTPLTGFLKTKKGEVLLLDSPGICQVKNNLDRLIFENIKAVIENSYLIWWLIEADDKWKKDNEILKKILLEKEKIIFLIINKIDLFTREQIMEKIIYFQKQFPFQEIIPISAKKKIHLNHLIEITEKYLENKKLKKSGDVFSLNSYLDIAKEILREQIVINTYEEVPHQTAVLVNDYKNNDKQIHLYLTIVVANQSQKSIIIGKGGKKVKNIRIGTQNILDKLWKQKPFISLQVKVIKDWYRKPHIIKQLNIDWKGI